MSKRTGKKPVPWPDEAAAGGRGSASSSQHDEQAKPKTVGRVLFKPTRLSVIPEGNPFPNTRVQQQPIVRLKYSPGQVQNFGPPRVRVPPEPPLAAGEGKLPVECFAEHMCELCCYYEHDPRGRHGRPKSSVELMVLLPMLNCAGAVCPTCGQEPPITAAGAIINFAPIETSGKLLAVVMPTYDECVAGTNVSVAKASFELFSCRVMKIASIIANLSKPQVWSWTITEGVAKNREIVYSSIICSIFSHIFMSTDGIIIYYKDGSNSKTFEWQKGISIHDVTKGVITIERVAFRAEILVLT